MSKSPLTDKWAQLYYMSCNKAMGIYGIWMFYLNDQTICPILAGIHIKVHIIMHINILCKMCLLIFDCLSGSVSLKYNVTIAPHNDWFYRNLIHASRCQKNFPNIYKTHGVIVQSKSCLFFA